ncbi:MAG TPA: recombination mediator RecR [Syntrophales bacterium]|nr:recombination mediator RecR [Syntrophales bacterium]HPC01465.1 recombination mediator RecR [Syntrophales bacterium]HRS87436.1 recombination mediator RecR [Syntrophales bacterium]HRV43406.1 recombination mediator RecR [Syntrophales bacterium]
MSRYAPPLARLIKELARFPGIGEKTAARLANFILHESAEDARRLAESILEVKEKIRLCRVCFNLSEGDVCPVCSDPDRDGTVICVVEDPDALIALEESGTYRGLYHVLHGVLSPLDGVGPEKIRVRELIERVRGGAVKEVILATNPSVQGEATAVFLMRSLAEETVRVSRIATGVPVGGDLKYADRMTLAKALEGRRVM